MIISCEFTNAETFVHERVVFLTDMSLMIDGDSQVFSVWWDDVKTAKSLVKLHTAMHDPEFRVYRYNSSLMMTRCVGLVRNWTVWFISTNSGERVYSKICMIQNAIRRWAMRRRLGTRFFSKAAVAYRLLAGRIHEDVMRLIVSYCIGIDDQHRQQQHHLKWIKPEHSMFEF